MSQFQESDFAKVSRVPFLAILGVAAIAGFITWQAIHLASEVSQRLICVWQGRDAAILFMVARRTVWDSVMIFGELFFVWRMAKARNTVSRIAALVGGIKIGFVILFATKVGNVVGLWLGSNFQICNEPIAFLCGWRIFQLIALMLPIVVTPGLMALADIAQGKLVSVQMRGRGALMAGSLVALYLGLCIVNPVNLHLHQAVRHQEEIQDDDGSEESGSSHLDGYRLTDDEPWEVQS